MRAVYFIRPIGMEGPIKIGCSFAPDGRRQTLETWSPFPLEVVAEIEGDYTLERRFHALFANSHRHREWFDATPELLALIEQINAGTFDLSSLPEPVRVTHMKGRDFSYITPEWCYERSVFARIRKSGQPWPVIYNRIVLPFREIIERDGVDAARAHFEPLIAEMCSAKRRKAAA